MGSYLEITPQHIACYNIYRYKTKLTWTEKFNENRQLILQEERIPVGKNETRDGFRVLVYKQGYQTYSKIAFVKYATGDKNRLLEMIEQHNLPLLLTKA